MKSTPLIVNWHDNTSPIYSCNFEPNGKGRLATAGGDNNVRLWRIESEGEDRKVEYLSTLSKHSQAVNVVRWAPKGEILASAGDDGNVLLWIPSEVHHTQPAFGEEGLEDKETWRVKHMCRSAGEGIYDLAWSPDGIYFIIGSMDNVARIYNAQTGQFVRQIAEHSHYIQGVAWDPLNEYVATQSSDRSVHIYTLRDKNGLFTLDQTPVPRIASHSRLDFPTRRISSSSPAPPDVRLRGQSSIEQAIDAGSPGPSAPGTPVTVGLPMNPPSAVSHSRRSSFNASPAMRRSASPAPSMPLPAVMPMENSPRPHSFGVRNGNLYANETLTSFFRRLTFTPDGALLLTPAGQYQTQQTGADGKPSFEVINTVYIYTRGGINHPPIAHLPGHRKPSVVVKCSSILYNIRAGKQEATRHMTIDSSSTDGTMLALPGPAIPSRALSSASVMDPPPLITHNSIETGPTSTPKQQGTETGADTPGPPMAFSLPYRMVYAVATQDSVLVYDTQQQTPLCVVSNLHFATFTDLTWSSDGLTLLMTSSDGFCSVLTFTEGELGTQYLGGPAEATTSRPSTATSSSHALSQNPFHQIPHLHARSSSTHSVSSQTAPRSPVSQTPLTGVTSQSNAFAGRPSSPTRSNSTSSVATQASIAPHSQTGAVISNPTLVAGAMPGIAASGSLVNTGPKGVATPPQTPRSATSSVSGIKRDAEESEKEDGSSSSGQTQAKKRRIAPTLVEK